MLLSVCCNVVVVQLVGNRLQGIEHCSISHTIKHHGNIKVFVWLYYCYLGNALYQSSYLIAG